MLVTSNQAFNALRKCFLLIFHSLTSLVKFRGMIKLSDDRFSNIIFHPNA